MNNQTRYSVVITAHNAARTIVDCLRSLNAQVGIARNAREIVLVDDRSCDGTAELALAEGIAGLRVLRIGEKESSPLTARQLALEKGIEAARGKIVLTLDADGLASPDWMASLVRPIEQNRADAVAGPVAFRDGWPGLAGWQTIDAAFYLFFCRLLNRMGLPAGVFFGNFAFRRDLYAALGGFRKIGFALTEDLAFARALQARGHRIHYSGRGSVVVLACESWRRLLERGKRVSAGGFSALSVSLGSWMALLPLLGFAAAVWGGPFLKVLVARIILGLVFAQAALLFSGCRRFRPRVLLYEPLAVLVGLTVFLKMFGKRRVVWGGISYER